MPRIPDIESGSGSLKHRFPSFDSICQFDREDADSKEQSDAFGLKVFLVVRPRDYYEVLDEAGALLVNVADRGFSIIERLHELQILL